MKPEDQLIDCRLCANYTTASGGCVSMLRCVDGSEYKATPLRQFWETTMTSAQFGVTERSKNTTGLEGNLRILGAASLHGELMSKTLVSAADEIAKLRGGYKRLREASDSEMRDGDLAREIAVEMLTPNV